ncbi:MAG: Flagellar hook-basal body complex protein FliE [Luteibacter sp.]|uniref:flagellar hook-basal body complex protein FliE n=1 Tax=Luteibacter sp. TaxID=1886636 RepID=UPI0013812A8B|nr:flagellar hook-basal body complex protein FliE [Luteibacter sp.]KAF1004679.1 MAG: Flagellar hook-basal body complex protein FliE [Luteibacter sp.]
MSLPPIQPIEAIPSPEWAASASPVAQGDFANMLGQGVAEVEKRIQVAEEGVARFATGDDIPPHQVMLALEDARMSLQFALQVRTRLVEGFQELMRMQL